MQRPDTVGHVHITHYALDVRHYTLHITHYDHSNSEVTGQHSNLEPYLWVRLNVCNQQLFRRAGLTRLFFVRLLLGPFLFCLSLGIRFSPYTQSLQGSPQRPAITFFGFT